jgi:hypothetical protein
VRVKLNGKNLIMLIKEFLINLQKDKRKFKFPKNSIYNTKLNNELWSKLEMDMHMFLTDARFNLADFGAWKNQITSDTEHDFERPIESFIDDLVGVRGMAKPENHDLENYFNYFQNDANFRWNLKKIKAQTKKSSLILADLGTILDLLVIESLYSKEAKISVLEIGGGYGRLALSALENRGYINQWNMIDIVPSSLALANSYLELNGHKSLFGVEYGPSQDTIRLLQLSKLQMIQNESIDLFVNIESFQEMTQDWVNFWIEVINQKSKKGSYLYHSNSFNYKNNFQLDLGSSWELVRSIESPRHWTTEHRTEIWVKI